MMVEMKERMEMAMERISRNLRFLLVCLIVSTASLECFTQEASADCHAAITVHVTAGNPDVVSGTIIGVNPADVWVVVFAQTDKWYIQPYSDQRAYLPVNGDGTYQTWIRDWKQISAFVIRKRYDALSNQQIYMPFPLIVDGVDVLGIAGHPTIQFSGYEWAVKGGVSLGPGPNHFSTSHDNVWVDGQGRLHLKITQRDGKWYCAEVYQMHPLGYGTFVFQFSSRVDLLNKNVIGSPFIYRDNSHELDVEFSRWGIQSGPNAQFVVQPHYHPGNREQFTMSLLNDYSTHILSFGVQMLYLSRVHGDITQIRPLSKLFMSGPIPEQTCPLNRTNWYTSICGCWTASHRQTARRRRWWSRVSTFIFDNARLRCLEIGWSMKAARWSILPM